MWTGALVPSSTLFPCCLYCRRLTLSAFDEQSEVIQDVALVKPKPGIFIDEINYLLVVSTRLSVFLLGVSSTDVPGPNQRPRKDIKLYATDLSISVEVEMSSVVGMNDGRIFMAGQDGIFYELHYQEKEGWFGKRIQVINHSIAGMKSLVPRLSTPSHEGAFSWLLVSGLHSDSLTQIKSYPSSPTPPGISSTQGWSTMSSMSINRRAKRLFTPCRQSTTCIHLSKEKLLALPL